MTKKTELLACVTLVVASVIFFSTMLSSVGLI